MSKTKHTPGPWKLCHHLQNIEKDKSCPCGANGTIWGGDGEHVVCEMGIVDIEGMGMCPPRYPRKTELANAHLIAAAPEMLEALELLVPRFELEFHTSEDDCRCNQFLDQLNCRHLIATRALAMARGEL